jgi:hypothetical protein
MSALQRAKVDRRRYPYRRAGLGLQEMRAAAKPGECPFCGDPALPRSRGTGDYHLGCGSPECKTAYFRLWRRDNRAALRHARSETEQPAQAVGELP